jgi:hypothetical protein
MTARERKAAYIYDDQQLTAVIEPVENGWRPVMNRREIGVFEKFAEAIKAIDEN